MSHDKYLLFVIDDTLSDRKTSGLGIRLLDAAKKLTLIRTWSSTSHLNKQGVWLYLTGIKVLFFLRNSLTDFRYSFSGTKWSK